jgi:hypothetical protein
MKNAKQMAQNLADAVMKPHSRRFHIQRDGTVLTKESSAPNPHYQTVELARALDERTLPFTNEI